MRPCQLNWVIGPGSELRECFLRNGWSESTSPFTPSSWVNRAHHQNTSARKDDSNPLSLT